VKYTSYLFFINYTSSLLMITSALIFLIFMTIKTRSLSSGGSGFLVNNSGRFIFLSVLILILAVSLKYFTEHSIIKSSINSLLHHKVLVKINGSLAGGNFIHAFGKAIENTIKFKDNGSHPTKRTDVEIYIGDNLFMKYILRQDSRDFNMYWLNASSKNYTMNLGFIKLEPNILESTVLERP
jgi:hypothetical protein